MAAATSSSAPLVQCGAATDAGRRRKYNEDALLQRPELGLFVVADGVGGRDAGDVASALTVASLAGFFEASDARSWPEGYRTLLDLTLTPAAQRLCAAIRKANQDVHERATTRVTPSKMSSTLVAAHLPSDSWSLHVGHVGDSRCYRLRDDTLECLTRDHTLRNAALLKHPDLQPDELEQIPSNVITRALGARASVELDVSSLEIQPGDRYLLCSDGVNRMLTDAEIAEAMLLYEDPTEACELLVQLANEAGGRDNSTALIIRCQEAP